jgi:CubicO group peptidase (beta-lactamase class C family)
MVSGTASDDPGLRAAIERSLQLGEVGVAVAAYLHGRLIADVWAGVDRKTVFPIFSVTKAVVAVAVHMQAERGLLDYDDAVARHWPEYAAAGKDRVTVRQVLMHRAGVPQMPAGVTPELMTDWDWMVEHLAAIELLYPPGAVNAYHSMSFGWILGEVVRRTDYSHRPFGRWVEEEIFQPLGIEDFWIGIPEKDLDRVARLTFPRPNPPPPEGSPVRAAVPPQVGLMPDVFNRRDVQRACVPAVGGIGSARAVARFFALLANGGELDGVRLLSEVSVAAMLRPRDEADAIDRTYGRVMPLGAGGLWLAAPGVTAAEESGARILCHTGSGGSIGWADLDRRLAVAICHNRMFAAEPEPPFGAVGDAIREFARVQAK